MSSEESAARLGVVARGLGRSFGEPGRPDRGHLIVAARDIGLTVPPGTVMGLLGPNGAGKTTTLRMLATLLRPGTGTATIAGHDILAEPLEVRRNLGYLTGDTGLYGRLTPRELLRFFAKLHRMAPEVAAARQEELVALLEIGPFADRRCEKLSSGQKQRVSIARAVLHDPPVLLLDEPTSGLDILAARDILRFFRAEADRGKAVVICTHILAEVELVCDRAAIIHHGTIRHRGTLDELRARAGAVSLSAGFFELLGEGEPA